LATFPPTGYRYPNKKKNTSFFITLSNLVENVKKLNKRPMTKLLA